MIRQQATVEQLRDFFQWHVERGCGADTVMIDRRGLEYLVLPSYVGKEVSLALPIEGESSNPQRHQIFLRAAFQ